MSDDPARATAVPLAEVTAGTAASAFNAGYEGYHVPVSFTAESFARRMRADGVDPGCSVVYFDGDRPAGVLLVARRGRVSRIAAVGFAPSLRGLGLGRRALAVALAAARARGDDRTVLEVITGNEPALALYHRAGFEVVRTLAGYRSEPAAGPASGPAGGATADDALADIGLDAARSIVTRSAEPGLPWQLQPESFEAAGSTVRGLGMAGTAAALVDEGGPALRLLALAVAPCDRGRGLGRALLRRIAARYAPETVSIVAVVPEAAATPFFTGAGWTRTAIGQYEMVCRHRPEH